MDDRIKEVLDYIEENLSEQFTLDGLAIQACLSPSQFHRVFKASTNRTPHRFIEEIRMNTAYQIIISDKISILELAMNLGYNNYETFTRAFKKYFHFSPDDLRSIVTNIKDNSSITETKEVIVATIDTDKLETGLIDHLKQIMIDKKVSNDDLEDAAVYKIIRVEETNAKQENLLKNKYQITNDRKIWELLIKTKSS